MNHGQVWGHWGMVRQRGAKRQRRTGMAGEGAAGSVEELDVGLGERRRKAHTKPGLSSCVAVAPFLGWGKVGRNRFWDGETRTLL